MISSRSLVSSPMTCRSWPQSQTVLSGSITSSMRGRCFGSDPRLALRGVEVRVGVTSGLASPSVSTRAIAVSISSSASSNWSGSIFSDLRPNMACLKAATRASRRAFCSCWARMMAFRVSMSSGRLAAAFMPGVYQVRPSVARLNAPVIHSAAVGGRAARAFTLRQSNPANRASNWA